LKELVIRPFQAQDFEQVKKIYQQGIDTKIATFETEAPTFEVWETKFRKNSRFVAAKNEMITGWVALSSVSQRKVYQGVCEVSLYVGTKFQGQRIGTVLLKEIIARSENQGIWTLQAGIFPENIGSINLHKKLGFREVGYREKIGMRDGKWHDNIFLERRSKVVGI